MNTSFRLLPAALTLLAVTGQAAIVIIDAGPGGTSLDLPIPDGGLGLTRTVEVTVPDKYVITEVQVTLNLSGGMAGDLYAYLVHGSELAVLLNRSGRTSSAPDGYNDPANFSITLHDGAREDIHFYRGPDNIPLKGPLTGAWQPDGRNVLPNVTTAEMDAAPRDAMLSSFRGLSGNGKWTLFLDDAASFDQAQLVSWELHLTLAPVPEPAEMMGVGGVLLLGFGLCRQRRRE